MYKFPLSKFVQCLCANASHVVIDYSQAYCTLRLWGGPRVCKDVVHWYLHNGLNLYIFPQHCIQQLIDLSPSIEQVMWCLCHKMNHLQIHPLRSTQCTSPYPQPTQTLLHCEHGRCSIIGQGHQILDESPQFLTIFSISWAPVKFSLC